MHLKMSSGKWRPFCLGLNVLTHGDRMTRIMRLSTRPSLVQIMPCRLFGAKPLSKHMMAYYQLDLWAQISVKFES